jgi:O-acetyl-ADP-ribose deacetylase (regulator of RNase III)
MIEIITGDLLTAPEQYIVHQTNCVTTSGAGLAYYLFNKFPYADVYATRSKEDCNVNTLRDKPGSIIVSGDGQDQRYVINLMGQLYPGGSWDDMPEDNEEMRHKFFYNGLLRIAKLKDLKSIAFPWKIGCGIAGGNWEYYYGVLENFTKYVQEQKGTKVVIYRRPGDE